MKAPQSFPLAPMSPLVVVLTALVLACPVVLALASLWAQEGVLLVVAGLVAAMCLAVWLWARPTRFEVGADGLRIVWPLRRRLVAARRIVEARLLERAEAKRELGWAIRVGVGGLWGAFGWLWSPRCGWVDTYVSRTDGLVWLRLTDGRPLLITPAAPAALVSALAAEGRPGSGVER